MNRIKAIFIPVLKSVVVLAVGLHVFIALYPGLKVFLRHIIGGKHFIVFEQGETGFYLIERTWFFDDEKVYELKLLKDEGTYVWKIRLVSINGERTNPKSLKGQWDDWGHLDEDYSIDTSGPFKFDIY